jgi:5-(carboxyamino)imidazole ribonucleotide mutase
MPQVTVLFGSKSDLKYWEESKKYLEYFEISSELKVLSAHRTPDEVALFAKEARKKGTRVIIAGAGMAAHLAGAIAAHTDLPVLGVPLL